MAPWFTPPIIVPLGLVVVIIAFAIYHAYIRLAERPQAIAIKVSSDANLPARPLRGWRA